MPYTLSIDSKPGFPEVARDDGLSATFSHFKKDEDGNLYVLVRVPTEFGAGWAIAGVCRTFAHDIVLLGLSEGSFTVPQEAWQ